MKHDRFAPGTLESVVAVLALTVALDASAQRAEPLPKALEGVGVEENLGDVLPLHLVFTDDHGRETSLGDLFADDRPVLLTMNYSNCPMLCSLQLNGLVSALTEMSWTIGDEYELVTVSIDPLETTTLARLTKQRYLTDYGREGSDDGWRFLTGNETNIRSLAETLGFGYRWVEKRSEYAHSAVTFVITPDGRISRYLYGVVYDPKTVRLSLVEASEGKLASTIDKVLLFCFHYDATEGRYGPAAANLMRAGGAFTLLVLGLTLIRLWRREKKHRMTEEAA